MKRVGYLYDKIFTTENLNLAINNACKNKKNRRAVKHILNHRDEIITELQSNPYYVSSGKEVSVTDKSSKKVRNIVAPDMLYLIKQHAILQVIYPIITRGYYRHSYGAVRGKGILKASLYLRSILKKYPKQTRYSVIIDTRKYYDSVDIPTLKAMLTRYFKDKKVLKLLFDILGDKEKGIPIGNYTSQIFANVYFTPLDHYIKEILKVKFYLRQMDDMLIISGNRRELIRYRDKIIQYLKDNLKCEVHKDKLEVKDLYKGQCIDFCGYKHYQFGKVAVRKRIFQRLRRTIFDISKCLFLKLARRFMSYWGYVIHSHNHKLVGKYLPLINVSNIRQIISISTKGATI